MFNFAEILTIVIGLLLALVVIDGIRRSLRVKKNKLKVNILPTSSEESQDLNYIEDNQELEEPKEISIKDAEDKTLPYKLDKERKYAEAYSFVPSFPFSEIRTILPEPFGIFK